MVKVGGNSAALDLMSFYNSLFVMVKSATSSVLALPRYK